MRILVTGGSGFIGTRLIEQLLEGGHDVTIFDKKPSSAYPGLVRIGDVRDKHALARAAIGHDSVYHLAAVHADNVRPISLYDEVNVGGAKNLVTAVEKAGIANIAFTSSVAVYPLNAGEPDEKSTIAPFNPYGESKYQAERVLNRWAGTDRQRSLVILRPCVVFGEDNRGNVYNLLSQIYSGRFISIGSGTNKKSMAYVGNLVKFMETCLGMGAGTHVFNYADKPDLTTRELVRIACDAFGRNSTIRIPYGIGLLGGYFLDRVSDVTGKTFPVSVIRIRKFCADTTVSTECIKNTGFRAPCTLEEALRRTIEAEFFGQERRAA